MGLVRRVLTSFIEEDQGGAQIYQRADGSFWVRAEDGSEFQLTAGGGGAISVTDGSTTVDPATSLDFTSGGTVSDGGGGVAQVAVNGGSVPVWLMSGDGSPVGAVTPSQQGAIYQDTTNGGLYEAIGASDADWISVGGSADGSVSGVTAGPGAAALEATAIGSGGNAAATVAALGDIPGSKVELRTFDGTNLVLFEFNDNGKVAFPGTPAITGSLSTVTDAAAKAVLTSIINALVAIGLATNGTT